MKQKLLVAPLLSITLFLIFSYPSKTYDIKSRLISPASSQALSNETGADLRMTELHLKKEFKTYLKSTTAAEMTRPAIDSQSRIENEPVLNLEKFVIQVSQDKNDHKLRGVHVAGTLALQVEQQPSDNSIYVSANPRTVTQFKSAADNGVVGLLAHNYLSGGQFYNLKLGQEVYLVYGDGKLKVYHVSEIERFQKLDPTSLSSDLININTGRRFTTNQVYNRYYTGSDHVTFQTCLAGAGISNWGLTFVVAYPSP